MATIARQMPLPGFDVCDIIEAIRANKLIPAALDRGARGLHRLLFRKSDVERFNADIMYVPGRTLSVAEAAVELGVKQEVAYHWVRVGLLTTTELNKPGEPGRRVTHAAIDAFQREYMTGVEFGKTNSIGPRMLAENLAALGVQPVSGPTVDGARQALFRRGDLERIDPTRMVSGRSKLQPKTAAGKAAEKEARLSCEQALDRALRAAFGGGLNRYYNLYRDEEAGVVIQAMSAQNSGTFGTYQFLLTGKHRNDLSDAKRGFLALGFHDRPDYLLVPWTQVEVLLPELPTYETRYSRMWRLTIRVINSDEFSPFGKCIRHCDRHH